MINVLNLILMVQIYDVNTINVKEVVLGKEDVVLLVLNEFLLLRRVNCKVLIGLGSREDVWLTI